MTEHGLSKFLKRFAIASIFTQRNNSSITFDNILYSTEYGSVVDIVLPEILSFYKIKIDLYEFTHCQIMYIFSNLIDIVVQFDYYVDGEKHENFILQFDYDFKKNEITKATLRSEDSFKYLK